MIVPVVLAAGASSRMGRCKALLPFADGRCALGLILDACAEAGIGIPIVVVGPPEADEVQSEIAGRAVALHINPARERGQLSSLQVGLAVLPSATEAFLIWPVDCPLVPGIEVRRLTETFHSRGARDTVVAFSYHRRRGHPILLAKSLVPAICALDPSGMTGTARDVIAANARSTFYLETETPAVICDIDTPEDYQRALLLQKQARWEQSGFRR